MQNSWDIVVLGAGPAGGEAARAASQGGARVLLIDEQARPGGQVWRARAVARSGSVASAEERQGTRHRQAIEESDVTFLGSARLWHIERKEQNWTLHIVVNRLSQGHEARCVILAPGAREFVQPFPGWTTPGVFGLAGVTALMKSQQCPPGRRVVVAGGGPLALFAAAEILRLGGEVTALVTPNSRSEWLRCLPLLALNPALAAKGAELVLRIRRAGVPVLWRHVVARASGDGELDHVKATPCTSDWRPTAGGKTLIADALCVGHGLVPNTEVAALAGLKLAYDQTSGMWVVPTGIHGETDLPGLFVCGDGAIVRGAQTAQRNGKRVGAAAAKALSGSTLPGTSGRPHRSERFGKAMTELATPRPGLIKTTDDDTIICRCETLTRRQLDTAIEAGANSLGALKSATRCGMGPCGGRYCMTAAARLIAEQTGTPPGSIRPPTPRPPLFPLPAEALVTGFEYADLPIPEPSPL